MEETVLDLALLWIQGQGEQIPPETVKDVLSCVRCAQISATALSARKWIVYGSM